MSGSLVTRAKMRVLFTTNPQSGNRQSLVPFADALQQAVQEVSFAATRCRFRNLNPAQFGWAPVDYPF